MLCGLASAHCHEELPAPLRNHSACRRLAAPPPPDSTITVIGMRLKTPTRNAPLPQPEHPETTSLVGSWPLSGFCSSTSISRSTIQPVATLVFICPERPKRLLIFPWKPLPNDKFLPEGSIPDPMFRRITSPLPLMLAENVSVLPPSVATIVTSPPLTVPVVSSGSHGYGPYR